jgi:Pretoxin HINT domain
LDCRLDPASSERNPIRATASFAAEDAGSDLADAGADGDDIDPGCDDSFSPATKVLLASGAAIPISQLKPGDKVLATNTKTGRTQAENVKAVIVEHDIDLYDLTVKAGGRDVVIQTTSHHRFWDQTTGRWTYAYALAAGDLLRTPGHVAVSVVSGQAPADTVGWMWDLTITHDHDFYIDVATTAVLVHNCPIEDGNRTPGNNQAQNKSFRAAVQEAQRQLGRQLSKDEIRRVHDQISGQGYGYHDIIDEFMSMYGGDE